MFFARRMAPTPLHTGQPEDRVGAAARRGNAPRSHPARSSVRFLPLLGLLLAIWGCGFGGLRRAPSLPVTHRPASELRLAIEFTSQFSDRPDDPGVSVLVRFFEGTNPDEVA